jgi:hypothetical protein
MQNVLTYQTLLSSYLQISDRYIIIGKFKLIIQEETAKCFMIMS